MELEANVLRHIDHSIELHRSLRKEAKTLITMADVIAGAFRRGNKVLLFGNGGSAADAQHIACELAGRFYLDRAPLPAIALTTNTSVLTGIGNDYSYEEVFSRQVTGLIKEGDVVIGLSTSGKSPNVIKGLQEAKKLGAITIAFTGRGGSLKTLADYALPIPSSDTPRVQEAHITAGHIICYLVEQALFEQKRND